MKKILLMFFMIGSLLLPNTAHAVPAIETEPLEISAKVGKIEEINRMIIRQDYNGSTFNQKINYYSIQLKDVHINNQDLNESQKITEKGIITVKMQLNEYNIFNLHKGDRIIGTVQFLGDESFNGYFLTNSEILNKT